MRTRDPLINKDEMWDNNIMVIIKYNVINVVVVVSELAVVAVTVAVAVAVALATLRGVV